MLGRRVSQAHSAILRTNKSGPVRSHPRDTQLLRPPVGLHGHDHFAIHVFSVVTGAKRPQTAQDAVPRLTRR